MTYEELLEESDSKGLTVKEKHLKGNKGLIIEKKIAIRKDIPTNEKACVLAEELGHHETSTGNILTMSQLSSRKQEKQARLWAYNKQIGLLGIIKAYENRCKNKSEISDFLGVTEKFLDDALKCYNQKYGVSVKVDNYVIYFEPNLYILKMI